HTHWVEIDLLRGGERPDEIGQPGAYYVLVKEAGLPLAHVWPIALRDDLPTILIPLRDDEVIDLRLQTVLNQVYAGGRYAGLVDSDGRPPPPALSPPDAIWAAALIQRWREAR